MAETGADVKVPDNEGFLDNRRLLFLVIKELARELNKARARILELEP